MTYSETKSSGLILLLVFTLFLSLFFYLETEIIPDTDQVAVQDTLHKAPKNPFSDIDIIARAAIVVDLNTNRTIYSLKSEEELPLASLAKIMTILVAAERLDSLEPVSVNQESIQTEGDSGLLVDEVWKAEDLLALTLVGSLNDGARALRQAVEAKEFTDFVQDMNEKAFRLGLSQTYFLNETGLDEGENQSSAYGSSRDVLTMFAYGVSHYPEIFEKTRYDRINLESLNYLQHEVLNTNILVEQIPGLVASKTGFTKLAGGNLSLIFLAGPKRPIGIVLLGSSIGGRFRDAMKLVDASLAYINIY